MNVLEIRHQYQNGTKMVLQDTRATNDEIESSTSQILIRGFNET